MPHSFSGLKLSLSKTISCDQTVSAHSGQPEPPGWTFMHSANFGEYG